MRPLRLALCLALAFLAPNAAHAQKRWKEIGKTAAGNSVLVDTRSVKTSKGITSARIEVKFTKPVDAGNGARWYSSRHEIMVDCARHSLASKSNVYYGDPAGTKEVKRDVIKIPGFGPTIGGSMGQVALDYLCKSR
jgi:hypothetical protein